MGLPSRIPRRTRGFGSAVPDASVASNVYTDKGLNYEVAIAGQPFILATSPDNPMVRRTAQYRKTQVDQSQEPGEQSIAQWWIKSQSTFHLGAGQKYIDTPTPGGETISELRYWTSIGVDPWTAGQVGLLNQTKLALSSATATLLTADADGSSTQFLVAAGSTLTRVTETVSAGVPTYTTASVTWGGTGTILSLTTDGTFYYVCDSTSVYRGKLSGGSPGAGSAIYTLPSGTSGVVLGWVKARLIALVNVGGSTPAAEVFTLQSSPSSPPAAMPAANYTHPNPLWQWTCITEGPSAIYAGGYAGNHSEVYRFTLDTSGDMPTLSGAASAFVLPPSELVLGMAGYVATALGIATTRGFRVGTFVDSGVGDIQVGPLSIRNTTLQGGVVGADRFFYCGGTHDDGTAGVFRVDTSQQLSIRQFYYTPDQIFGWAPDIRAADDSESAIAGAASALGTTADGRIAFLVPGFGLYVQHPSQLVPTGSLTTSQIRYQTLDPKLFRFVRVRGTVPGGRIAVSVAINDEAGETVGYLDPDKIDTDDLSCNIDASVAASVTFTLTRDGDDSTSGPTLMNYQFKALPAQRRQREVILPLSLFDNERDNTGQWIGQRPALVRLRELEDIEQRSDIVTLQFPAAFPDQQMSEFVVIDSIEFRETSDPVPEQGWGGVAVVTCRTIT